MLLQTLTTPQSGVSCLGSFHSATSKKGWFSCDHRLGKVVRIHRKLLLWKSRKLPRLLFQNCEPCHTRENLWLQGGKPYTHPLTWLPRSRCLWSERYRMRPSCVMQRLLNLEQMMVGPKWMVMLYIGKSHSQKLLFSDFIWWGPSAWEKGPGHCSQLWPVSTIEFCLWCLPEL